MCRTKSHRENFSFSQAFCKVSPVGLKFCRIDGNYRIRFNSRKISLLPNYLNFHFCSFRTDKLKPVNVNKMYGALDLGGGSVQITIPLDEKVDLFVFIDYFILTLFIQHSQSYTHSFIHTSMHTYIFFLIHTFHPSIIYSFIRAAIHSFLHS